MRKFTEYITFDNLLKVLIAVPATALGFFVTYIVYLVIQRNTDTIVALSTPYLIQVIVFGVVAVVIVVFAAVIYGIYVVSKRRRY